MYVLWWKTGGPKFFPTSMNDYLRLGRFEKYFYILELHYKKHCNILIFSLSYDIVRAKRTWRMSLITFDVFLCIIYILLVSCMKAPSGSKTVNYVHFFHFYRNLPALLSFDRCIWNFCGVCQRHAFGVLVKILDKNRTKKSYVDASYPFIHPSCFNKRQVECLVRKYSDDKLFGKRYWKNTIKNHFIFLISF